MSSAGPKPLVRVVAAALYDPSGRVLIAERPPGKPLAGRWEFPGGKLHTGETEWQALRRELREELGIDVRTAERALEIAHEYPERHILLSLWRVTAYSGEPRGLDGQALKWVEPRSLGDEDLLEADRPFVELLSRTSP